MPDARELIRFQSKILVEATPRRAELGPCWRWTGALTHTREGSKAGEPYGAFKLGGRVHRANRVAAEWLGGLDAAGFVLHRCDFSMCVNPSHLVVGTHDENMADMVSKGRMRTKLCESEVVEIRELSRNGQSLGTLAKRFGVHKVTISHLVKHRTWKHVP